MYRIGNLTLLERNLNRDAQQKPFVEKLKYFKQSKSMLTQKLIDDYNSWNEDKIASRQKELAKHAKGIWKIQELN